MFAAEAPVAVILRRGPRRHWRLIRWDTRNDTFELGQWMKGEVNLCDLSPDGTKLLYRASQYHATNRLFRRRPLAMDGGYEPLTPWKPARNVRPKRPYRKVPRYLRTRDEETRGVPREPGTDWTAISRPPYFSALAIWPSIGRWTGGGFFGQHGELVLYESQGGLTPITNAPLPASLTISAWANGESRATAARLPVSGLFPEDRYPEPLQALAKAGRHDIDWITDLDGPDLLFADDGLIYRLPEWRRSAPIDLSRAKLLIDLQPMSFEQIAPPGEVFAW